MEQCRYARAAVSALRQSSPLRPYGVWARFLIALALLLAWLGPASAYVEPPFVTNPPAVEGQEFTVDVRWGRCDLIQSFDPLDREVSVSGSTVAVTVRHALATGAGCIFPDGGSRLRLGPFPAGTYRIDIRLRRLEVPSVVIPGPSSTIVVQSAQGGGPVAIPGLSLVGLATLSFLLAGMGVVMLRR